MTPSHHHSPQNYNRAFAIGVGLNIAFVVIEVFFGLLSGSLALLADAGHNLSDVLSLLLAWGASWLSSWLPTRMRTYGFRRVTLLASLFSALLLLFAMGGIAWEASGRLLHSQPVAGPTVIAVALVGVVINSATALLFLKGQKHDLNLRAAYLHMAADAAISLGVVIAGILIVLTGWLWIDPALSLLIVLIIVVGSWGLLKESLNLSIDAVPSGIEPEKIRKYLLQLDGVCSLHDLHIWALSTTDIALTVHLVSRDEKIDNALLQRIQDHLQQAFSINHATIQVELESESQNCQLNHSACIVHKHHPSP